MLAPRFKIFLAITCLCFSAISYAERKVRIFLPDVADVNELELTIPMQSAGSNFDLFWDIPSGDATSRSGAAKIYIPVLGDPATENASIYSLNGSSKAANLPRTNTGLNATVRFEKEVTISSGTIDYFLYAAVESDEDQDDWRVVVRNPTPVPNPVTEGRFFSSFNLSDVCEFSEEADCDRLVDSNRSFKVDVYFFLGPENLGFNKKINPDASNFNHGVYYELNFSSNINDSVTIDILEAKRRDGAVDLKYRSNQTIDDFERVIVTQYIDPSLTDVTTIPSEDFIGDYAGFSPIKLFDDDFAPQIEGTILVEPLKNGKEAYLSAAFVDKYQFVTRLSIAKAQTPLEVSTLLNEQSCFFFTAGFGRQHYVVDRLQHFRDEILMSSPLGQVFVDLYYQFAPQYAPFILERPWLQKIVQITGHSLVFMIDFFLAFVFSGLAFFAWLLLRAKFKTLSKSQSKG